MCGSGSLSVGVRGELTCNRRLSGRFWRTQSRWGPIAMSLQECDATCKLAFGASWDEPESSGPDDRCRNRSSFVRFCRQHPSELSARGSAGSHGQACERGRPAGSSGVETVGLARGGFRTNSLQVVYANNSGILACFPRLLGVLKMPPLRSIVNSDSEPLHSPAQAVCRVMAVTSSQ